MGFTVDITTLDIPENILVKMALLTMETDSFLGMHTHYTLELSMILAGEGEYRVDDRVYPVTSGDILLFNNTEFHGLWNTGDQPLVNLAVEFEPRFVWSNPTYTFDQAFLATFFERNEQFQNKLDRNNPAFPAIQRQFTAMQAEFDQQLPRHEAVIKADLLGILAQLLRHYDLVGSPSAGAHHADMDRIMTYIAEHYRETLPLATLADMLHMNESYFCRVFRKCNGISPKEYIVKLRIADAARQLKSSPAGVLEIAESCGFNSASNFYTVFKRITGQSPAQYRLHPLE